MNRRLLMALAASVAVLGSIWVQVIAQTESPEAVVHETAEAILAAIDGRREHLRENTDELHQVVRDVFLPRFDQGYAAYLVLGRHGRQATTEQRSRFTNALYNYLLNQYAVAILRFTPDRLQVVPYEEGAGEERATIRTFVLLDDNRRIPVNYEMRLSEEGWRLYDVVIEGISYIRNLRSQLNSSLEREGIDRVIERLENNRGIGSASAVQ